MVSPERQKSRDESVKDFVLPEQASKTAEFLQEIVDELMQDEYRKDAEFRLSIVTSELGDVSKYLTHDQKLNPPARPHGTKEDEKLAYGELLMMVFTLMWAREIPIEEALRVGLQNWIERDWKKKEGAKRGDIIGKIASRGRAEGKAFVVSEEFPIDQFPGEQILVTSFFKPDMTHVVLGKKPMAIVTDHGGVNSHGAIIAREFGIPAVVGCGNATERIPLGAKILVEADKNEGRVKLIEEKEDDSRK